MIVRQGDVIRMQIRERANEGWVDNATSWENVDRVVIPKKRKPSGKVPKHPRPVRVTGIADGVAYAKLYNHPRYVPLFKKKLTLDVSDWEDGRAAQSGLGPVKFVAVEGDTPVPRITAYVKKVVRASQTAYIDAEDLEFPQEGQRVTVHGRQGSKTALLVEYDLRIRLTEPSRVTSLATVRIQRDSESGELVGEIESYRASVPTTGDVVEATVDVLQDPAIAAYEDVCRIPLAEPALVSGEVSVLITNDDPDIMGRIQAYRESVPEVGDEIDVRVIRGRVESQSSNPRCRVIFDESAPISGRAVAKITAVGAPMRADLVSIEGLPSIGDSVQVTVNPQHRTADGALRGTAKNGAFEVALDGDVPCSGTVTAVIRAVEPAFRGSITEYGDGFPAIDDTVSVHIADRKTPIASTDEYEIVLPANPLASGSATARITAVGATVEGVIVEYHDVPAVDRIISVEIDSTTHVVGRPLTGDFVVEIENEDELTKTGIAKVQITQSGTVIAGRVLHWEETTQHLDNVDVPRRASYTDNSALSRRKM